jgi:hypothetical protein
MTSLISFFGQQWVHCFLLYRYDFDFFKASRSKIGLAASNSATVILYCFAMEYFVSCGKISRTTTSDVGSFVSLDFSKSSLLL